jgi:hypothetical protein
MALRVPVLCLFYTWQKNKCEDKGKGILNLPVPRRLGFEPVKYHSRVPVRYSICSNFCEENFKYLLKEQENFYIIGLRYGIQHRDSLFWEKTFIRVARGRIHLSFLNKAFYCFLYHVRFQRVQNKNTHQM